MIEKFEMIDWDTLPKVQVRNRDYHEWIEAVFLGLNAENKEEHKYVALIDSCNGFFVSRYFKQMRHIP